MHGIGRFFLVWALVGLLVVNILSVGDGKSAFLSREYENGYERGEIIAGSVLDIQTLNPCRAHDEHTLRILSLVYDTLAYVNRTTGSAEPGLAVSWESSDGYIWNVKLRENLKWHDGTALTADDIVFTYNFFLDPEKPLKTSEYFSFLRWVRIPGSSDKNESYWEAVQKVDATTVKFVLNKTVWDFGLTILSLPILKKEIWRNHWGDATTWNLDHDSVTGSSKSVGTGPYKLVTWKPGKEIVLTPNLDYYKPVSCGIRILKYSSYSELLESAKRKEIALIFHPIPLEFLPDFTNIDTFSAFPSRAKELTFLGFNLEKYFEGYDEGTGYQQRSSIDDPVTYPSKVAGVDAGLQFRNAAAYLLPNNLLEEKYPNILLWENSIVHRGSQYYNTSVKTYTLSIDKAVTLLDSANYKDADGDGWREDYSGRKMGHDGIVKIYIEERDTLNQQLALWFCANLRSAGVNADTAPIQVLNIRDYDLFLCTVHTDENFEYVYKLLNSKYDYTDGITNGENLWRYRNPDTDNLTTSMLSTNAFANAIRTLQGIVSLHLPIIPLYSRIRYEVMDLARVSVNSVTNESILEKHNIVSMRLIEDASLEAYAIPFRIAAITGSRCEIIVRVSNNGNPIVDAAVHVRISPSYAVTLDAQTKTTDSNGCAFFSLSMTRRLGIVKTLCVECNIPAKGLFKRFYLVIEPLELLINILSEPFLKGLANNTYTFLFEIRNVGVPIMDAFTRLLYISDSRIKPLIAENLSDASGRASFVFLISEDYTENSHVQITFALSLAGGEEQAYSVALVVATAGSLELRITTECYGVDWKTGKGEIRGFVSYEGNPVRAMNVKCGIIELEGIFEIENPEQVTDREGSVKFSVTVNQMPLKSRYFSYYLVVATPSYHGLVYSRSILRVPDTVTPVAHPSPIEIKGEKGRNATLVLNVEAEGRGIQNAVVFGWKGRADSRFSIVGLPGITNGTGNIEIKIQITKDYVENAELQLIFKVVFWGKENGCIVDLRILRASIPIVSVSLSENETEGVAGNSVTAIVHVSREGVPLSAVNVTLVLSSKRNLEVVPSYALTDNNGTAEFEIIVVTNFTREETITVNAKAVVGENSYTGRPVPLKIFPAGRSGDYTVSLTLSAREIYGKEGEQVILTGNVKKGNVPVPNVNFTVEISGSTDVQIQPQYGVTDSNGNSYFVLKVMKNLDRDIEVILRGKISVEGKEYSSLPVTLKIKAYGEQKSPGFDILWPLLVLVIVPLVFAKRKKRLYR